MTQLQRWLRFNLVGVGGFAVQMLTLAAVTGWVGLPDAIAVAAAVLAAVSHNFLWHERVTWPERPRHGRGRRWLAFNLSTGIVSVVMNVLVTTWLTAITGTPLLVANAVAVGMASVTNFLISDRFVFSVRMNHPAGVAEHRA
jgi:putative flippase GtrA